MIKSGRETNELLQEVCLIGLFEERQGIKLGQTSSLMVLDSQPARTSLTDNLVPSIFFLSFQFSTWNPALCHLISRDEETDRLKLGEEIEKSQFSKRTKS